MPRTVTGTVSRTLSRAVPCVIASALALCSAAPSGAAPAPPESFLRAEGRRAWSFPRDHGQHPRYRLEWWYYTGIVRTEAGRAFGYQVTFFRQGLAPAPAPRESAWAVRSLWLGHAALSDPAEGTFSYATRAGRDSLGLSGAAPDAQRVWLGPWRAEPLPVPSAPESARTNSVRLAVDDPAFALELDLHAEKPPVLHGTGGLDRKGAAPGQASWYYSLPRLATHGTVTVHGRRHAVSGLSWMDHEFGTNQLGPRQVGWDWFALHLSDGYDLMLYRLRLEDGRADAVSGGTLIDPRGGATRLRLAADTGPPDPGAAGPDVPVLALPLRWWNSPLSGGRYPVAWELESAALGAALRVEPLLEGQELAQGRGLPFPYWEGAVRVHGEHRGRPVTGEGYLELTGYAGDLRGAFQ